MSFCKNCEHKKLSSPNRNMDCYPVCEISNLFIYDMSLDRDCHHFTASSTKPLKEPIKNLEHPINKFECIL